MNITRKTHSQFLDDELKAEVEDFEKKFYTSAVHLLHNSGEMFVAKFLSFKNGEMIMQFPNTRPLPRKGEFLLCMALPARLQNYHNWGKMTYRDLYVARHKYSECVCIWHGKQDEEGFSLVGFGGVSIEFMNYISQAAGMILVFAPPKPPIEYIKHLRDIVKGDFSPSVSAILDADYGTNDWKPIALNADNVLDFISAQLSLTDTLILEGPPGTGKTFLIAELCARLCEQGKSVLVTALTNRALIEIAQKSSIADLLEAEKVFKTNITTDEQQLLKKLQPLSTIAPMPARLVLSTYYITSGFAAEAAREQPFDYVIVDEASQALLAMLAVCRKIGRKSLIVGDTHQLAPIVALNDDRVTHCGYRPLVNGLELLAGNSSHPVYQLTKSYRFSRRAAEFTSLFYTNPLSAEHSEQYDDLPSMKKVLNLNGGPSLILTDMDSGDTAPRFALTLIVYIVGSILNDDKERKIAVLSLQKASVRAIQTSIHQSLGSHTNLLVDTIARVQGLTTDITILFLPDCSYVRSLEPHLFNVATSRARQHTIIVADKYIFDKHSMDSNVRKYLERLKDEQCIYISAKSISDGYLQELNPTK